MTTPAHTIPIPLGPTITATVALALAMSGVVLAVSSPLLSGGHLIGGPALIAVGGALAARLAYIQVRGSRR